MTGKARAYTLVEMVMVVVITGIVAAIGVPMMLQTVNAWCFGSQFQNQAVTQAIVITNRMSKEMRRLSTDTSVTTATASQFTFTALGGTSITFNRSGNNLMRNSDTLANNVTSLAFTYYDDSGNTIATPAVSPNSTNIARIRVAYAILAGSNTLNFQFDVRPQNLARLNERFK
jgi:prepilin-type N-terminal cleavage/methylation domain-containing protein